MARKKVFNNCRIRGTHTKLAHVKNEYNSEIYTKSSKDL